MLLKEMSGPIDALSNSLKARLLLDLKDRCLCSRFRDYEYGCTAGTHNLQVLQEYVYCHNLIVCQ